MTNPTTPADKLRQEAERIKARRERRRKEDETDSRRLRQIEEQLRKLDLVALVGVPDGVKLRCRLNGRGAGFNDALGTISKVCRTRATMTWNTTGDKQWTCHLDMLMPASGVQGFVMELAR